MDRHVIYTEKREWDSWAFEAARAGVTVSSLVREAMASRGKAGKPVGASVEAAPKGKSPKRKAEPASVARGGGEFRGSFPRKP